MKSTHRPNGPCVLMFMGSEAELHTAGDLTDRGVGSRLVLTQRLVDGCQHQIFQHLDVVGIDRFGLDLDLGDLTVAVDRRRDYAAAGLGRELFLFQLPDSCRHNRRENRLLPCLYPPVNQKIFYRIVTFGKCASSSIFR